MDKLSRSPTLPTEIIGNQQYQDQYPTTNIEDTSLVAFMVLNGFGVKLWLEAESGRVSFDIVGNPQDIGNAMQNYYSNKEVGILDYVKCLKSIKTQMYNFKKQRKDSDNES